MNIKYSSHFYKLGVKKSNDNLGYITQDIVNPKTKEIYSKDSYVEISLNEMKLIYK